jgi:hypothetical protein
MICGEQKWYSRDLQGQLKVGAWDADARMKSETSTYVPL